MPAMAGLPTGHTERVQGTSGRGAGVFRDAVSRQLILSFCVVIHPEGRTPRPAVGRSAEGIHTSQETGGYFCILDNDDVFCVQVC